MDTPGFPVGVSGRPLGGESGTQGRGGGRVSPGVVGCWCLSRGEGDVPGAQRSGDAALKLSNV